MIYGSLIGKRFDGATFDSFKVDAGNRAAIEACKRLVAGESDGVVLLGPVGGGKTHLLVATAREFDRLHSSIPERHTPEEFVRLPSLDELMASQKDSCDYSIPSLKQSEISHHAHVQFWAILDLVAALRKDSMEDNGQLPDRCLRCDLLVLDDLGREKISEFVLQELQRIIDYRYRQMLPIAVASNMKRGEIASVYGEHTISRWLHSCEVIGLKGADYRIEEGK